MMKNINKEIEIKQKDNMKKDKEHIIARVRANKRPIKELEKLHG